MTLADRLRAALETGHRSSPELIGGDVLDEEALAHGVTPAAVLVAVVDRPEPTVILTLRPETMRKHPGQVSFPGGRIDPDDEGPLVRPAEQRVAVAVLGHRHQHQQRRAGLAARSDARVRPAGIKARFAKPPGDERRKILRPAGAVPAHGRELGFDHRLPGRKWCSLSRLPCVGCRFFLQPAYRRVGVAVIYPRLAPPRVRGGHHRADGEDRRRGRDASGRTQAEGQQPAPHQPCRHGACRIHRPSPNRWGSGAHHTPDGGGRAA